MKEKKLYRWFRKIAMYEGVSFLVLLLIAMPLKYMAGLPMAVTIIGGLHGILFLAFLQMAFSVKTVLKRNMMWMIKAFVASIIPFGTFMMDKEWKKEELAIPANR